MTYFASPRDKNAARNRPNYTSVGSRPKIKDVPVMDRLGPGDVLLSKRFATSNVTPQIRRTSRDSKPPRRVRTAELMGDPKPGRSAQDQMEGRGH